MNWATFFPEGTPVVAIPGWSHPKLFVVAYPRSRRWHTSALYPAYRGGARVRRWLLRAWALAQSRVRRAMGPYLLADITVELWGHNIQPMAVLLGTPGPAQKLVVLFASDEGGAVGFLKYGESPAAKTRLEQEYRVLRGLPEGLAPKALGLFRLGNGLALVTSAVEGRRLGGRVWPSPEALVLLRRLGQATQEVGPTEHPWVQPLLEAHPLAALWVDALTCRKWGVVAVHGDFTPWNLLLSPSGAVALDWEYGSLQGFPGADLVYHVLQTAALLKRWPPEKAREVATLALSGALGLGQKEALALVRLTALRAYLNAQDDGHAPNGLLQLWRERVWKQQ